MNYPKSFREANILYELNVDAHDNLATPRAVELWDGYHYDIDPYGAENHLSDYIRNKLREAYKMGDRNAGAELNKPDRILTHAHYTVPVQYVEIKHRIINHNKSPNNQRDFFINLSAYATLRMRLERGDSPIILHCLRFHDKYNVRKQRDYANIPFDASYAGYTNALTNAMRICYVYDDNKDLMEYIWGDAIKDWKLNWKRLDNPTGGSDHAYIEVSPDWLMPFDQFVAKTFNNTNGKVISINNTSKAVVKESTPEACKQCGLYLQGHNDSYELPLPGDGVDHPDIIFIGEALGEEEQKQGKPFVGKSGQLLRNTVQGLGIENVRYTNVVRCRPPDNRTPTRKEIQCCTQYLENELAECDPRVVVLLGNTPLHAVLSENGISSFQGQIINKNGITYVPLYHPAYALRGGEAAIDEWRASFSSVIDALYSNGEEKAADAHYQYLYPTTVDELEDMYNEIISNPEELLVCDIESINLDVAYPDNKIISIALANSNKAWSFPIDHKDSWWSEDERVYIIEDVLRPILTQCKIINHNIKFECKMIRHFLGIDFVPHGDTIQLSRLVSPQALEHGLKRLAGIHLQMFDYDEELRQYVADHPECDYGRGGNYGNIPLNILLPYGGKDVSATRLLYDALYEQLTPKQRVLYEQMIIQADYAIGLIEENGFKLDYWLVNRYQTIYQTIMDKKYIVAMERDEHVVAWLHAQDTYNRLESLGLITKRKVGKKYKCELKYGDTPYNFDKDDWHEFYELNRDKIEDVIQEQPKRKLLPIKFNPGSSKQVASILFTYKKLKPEGTTDGGQPSIKRDLLKKVIFNLRSAGNHVPQFLLDYMDWKLLQSINTKTFKAMSDPAKDWYSADGRVHSNYTIGGAKTGRTSSSQPNLQNIPAIEKEPGTVLQYLPAKNCFTHTFPGGGLAMFDYSGMELRVIASIAGIQGMIDTFNRDGDVHRYVSSFIYKKPEDQITKDERYRGKWCNWSLLYLGNEMTLYDLYGAQGLTLEEAAEIAKLYHKLFPELANYHKCTEQFIMKNNYAESAFGRRLPLSNIHSDNRLERKDALHTGVNMPIQGLASDVLMLALSIIVQLMRQKQYRSMFVNTVHDSLVLDYHPDEKEELVALCLDVMENIVDYSAKLAPDIDFSWLKVPLKADVEFGTHYGSYGFHHNPMCECGGVLVYVTDLGDTIDYQCQCCGNCTELKYKPLLYNNTCPEALALQRKWAQVLEGNDNYNQERQPRKDLIL